ncbi:hypothetical protein OsJ_25238 [Oryza sativa Japonica Group]|uniref:Uncharacterized protein n=1 Tax=Oryza sativa subsp. japonica TaxID=39947 RepID=B9FUD8_ORYSJ|nr:hypothetical protein OsJ_25238 [Oryza sativa Japonica Group]
MAAAGLSLPRSRPRRSGRRHGTSSGHGVGADRRRPDPVPWCPDPVPQRRAAASWQLGGEVWRWVWAAATWRDLAATT